MKRLMLIALLSLCVNTAWAQTWFGLKMGEDTLSSVKAMLEKDGAEYEINNIEGDRDMPVIYTKDFKRGNMRSQRANATFRFLSVQTKEGKTEPLLSRITVKHDDPSFKLFIQLRDKFETLGYNKRRADEFEYYFEENEQAECRVGLYGKGNPLSTSVVIVSQKLISGENLIENAIQDAKAEELVKSMFG